MPISLNTGDNSDYILLLCEYTTGDNDIFGDFINYRSTSYYQSAVVQIYITTTDGSGGSDERRGYIKTSQTVDGSGRYTLVTVDHSGKTYFALRFQRNNQQYSFQEGFFVGFARSTDPDNLFKPLLIDDVSNVEPLDNQETVETIQVDRMGINTDNPTHTLHVNGVSRLPNITNIGRMTFNDGRFYIQRGSSEGFDFNNTRSMVLRISGDQAPSGRDDGGDGLVIETSSRWLFSVNGHKNTVGISGDLTVEGSLAKGSGSFNIVHPLTQRAATHRLVHSFVEAPRADLVYSGMVRLTEGGHAEVDIDAEAGMTHGTFEALTRPDTRRRSCTNEQGFSRVRSRLDKGVLTLEAEDPECRDEVFWSVIAERCDDHMRNARWTDDQGRVIVEPPIVPKSVNNEDGKSEEERV